MANLNFNSVSKPFEIISSSFSDIFGNNYSSSILNLQLESFENLSNKLDLIQKELNYIIENLDEIEELIKEIPSKTITELYKKDLNSLFILIREKINAFIVDRKNDKIKANKIFQPIFQQILYDIQKARAKIFLLNNHFDLPLVSSCFHLEVFCLVLSEQPKSIINSTLTSYKKWISDVRDNLITIKLKELQEEHLKRYDQINEGLVKKYSYEWRLIGVRDHRFAGDENLPIEFTYEFTFKKFGFQYIDLNDDLNLLIEKGYILDFKSLSNNVVAVLDDKFTYDFNSYSPLEIKPFNIKGDYFINESLTDVINNKTYTNANFDINNIGFINNSFKIIIYASLNNLADITLNSIENFLGDKNISVNDSFINYGYAIEKSSREYNDRLIKCIQIIEQSIEKIDNEQKKQKLSEIKTQMDNLKANSSDILKKYRALEIELSQNLPLQLLEPFYRILEPIGKELERGVQNIARESEKLASDLGKNFEKAIQDIGNQIETDADNFVDAINAIDNYVENQINSWGKTLTDADKRIREGKIIDALWHTVVDPLKHQDDNLAILVQESSLINNIATAAASIYGGPQGAAAYAAWYTYKQTGNLSLALKAGVISGLTSKGISLANGMPANAFPEIAKRSLVMASIGAISIAASGGSEKDIINGFLKGATLSMAREYYNNLTKQEIEGRAPSESAIPKLNKDYTEGKYLFFLDKDGNPLQKTYVSSVEIDGYLVSVTKQSPWIDVSSMPKSISMVGLATDSINGGILSETGVPMQLLAKVPYINDMAYLHDIWCDKIALELGQELNMAETMVSIIPATIVTVTGSDTPILAQILEEIRSSE